MEFYAWWTTQNESKLSDRAYFFIFYLLLKQEAMHKEAMHKAGGNA
jgi:hypothetical protein